MNAIVINDINVNFEVMDERVFISSLELGEVFNKRHDVVLRAIENLPKDDFFNQNFEQSSRIIKNGFFDKASKTYNLTRDGFSLLVMGFTGEKAYKWKIEFIKAFNLMEAELKRQSICRYVNKISNLEADSRLKAKHYQDQINGYLGKLTAVNKEKELLKAELTLAKNQIKEREFKAKPFNEMDKLKQELKNVKADAHNYRLDMEFFMKKYRELKDESIKTENVSIKALDTIQEQMEHIFTAIGAVKSFINDGNCYFIENNEILKG